MKKTTTIHLILFSFFVFLISCSSDEDTPQFSLDPASVIDIEDYSVYSTVIGSYNTNYFVLRQKTLLGTFIPEANDYIIDNLSENNPGFEPEMLATLNDVNQNPLFLGYSFTLSSTQIVLVSDAQINYIFNSDSNNDWMQFYNTFPGGNGGYNMFSNVAYNSDHTKALVESDNVCGPLCGLGTIIYLEKENGIWIIKKSVDTWIS